MFYLNTFSPDCKIIGERIRTLRGEKTTDEVADAIGVCRSAISMYESGSRIPRDDVKIRIANYFGKSVQEIFFAE